MSIVAQLGPALVSVTPRPRLTEQLLSGVLLAGLAEGRGFWRVLKVEGRNI